MRPIFEWWQQLPEYEQSVLVGNGLAVIFLLILVLIRKNIQTGLTNLGIDQILIIPGAQNSVNKKLAWLSPSLSWLTVITLGLVLFDIFSEFSFSSRFDVHKLLIKLWFLLVFYIGSLFLVRKCIIALATFLIQPQIKQKLQRAFSLNDEKTDSRYGNQDTAAALVDFISTESYCISALVFGIFFVAAFANPEIISVLVVGFLSGLGRLSIAFLMAGLGFAAIRYIYYKNNEFSENTAFYLSSLTLIGCIFLALTLLGNTTGSIFWPLLIVLLLFAALAIMASDSPVNMADILAGLYLRFSGGRDSQLSAEFEGYRLNRIGWETSNIINDNGEQRDVKNSYILAFISKESPRNANGVVSESRQE